MFPTQMMWLFLAGGLGTLARYGLASLFQRWFASTLPLGTFVVNISGCLLFGFIVALASEREAMSDQTRLLFLVGFMGAFTTFSTFAFETGQMIQTSQWGLACLNLMAHNGLGLAALFIGMALAKLL